MTNQPDTTRQIATAVAALLAACVLVITVALTIRIASWLLP